MVFYAKWSFYKPAPDVQSPSTPVDPIQRATMQELLFGPFPSRAAVDHLSGQSSDTASRGPILASSSLITTSGCTSRSFFNALTLPQHLQPGYYDLLLTGSSTYASGSSDSESEIPLKETSLTKKGGQIGISDGHTEDPFWMESAGMLYMSPVASSKVQSIRLRKDASLGLLASVVVATEIRPAGWVASFTLVRCC
jgi:hypothetical protein